MRPCLEPGCPTLTNGSRCLTHTRTKDRARGSRQARGYDAAHEAERRALLALLPCPCGYGCGRTLTTPNELVAAHRIDGHPEYGYLPACTRCNQRARATNHTP